MRTLTSRRGLFEFSVVSAQLRYKFKDRLNTRASLLCRMSEFSTSASVSHASSSPTAPKENHDGVDGTRAEAGDSMEHQRYKYHQTGCDIVRIIENYKAGRSIFDWFCLISVILMHMLSNTYNRGERAQSWSSARCVRQAS